MQLHHKLVTTLHSTLSNLIKLICADVFFFFPPLLFWNTANNNKCTPTTIFRTWAVAKNGHFCSKMVLKLITLHAKSTYEGARRWSSMSSCHFFVLFWGETNCEISWDQKRTDVKDQGWATGSLSFSKIDEFSHKSYDKCLVISNYVDNKTWKITSLLYLVSQISISVR